MVGLRTGYCIMTKINGWMRYEGLIWFAEVDIESAYETLYCYKKSGGQGLEKFEKVASFIINFTRKILTYI